MLGNGLTPVNDVAAQEYMGTLSLNAGRKSEFGDKTQFHDFPRTHNAIGALHEYAEYVLPKMAALTKDITRTQPQIHDVGRQFAERTNEVAQKVIDAAAADARDADAEADEIISSNFAADPSREGIQSEIRVWMRENGKTEGGLAKIREEMQRNAEVAAVLYHSPNFLLGIGEATRKNMVMDAVAIHLPKAASLKVRSSQLSKLAASYPA